MILGKCLVVLHKIEWLNQTALLHESLLSGGVCNLQHYIEELQYTVFLCASKTTGGLHSLYSSDYQFL